MLGSLKIARFVSIFTAALLAGILVDFWAFTAPALASLPASTYVEVQQALNRNYLAPIPLLYTVVNVSALAVVILLIRARKTLAFALSLVALLCSVLLTASTLLINVPINAEVLTWSPQAPPVNWAEVRDRWNQAHTLRTALAAVALGCQILAALIPFQIGVRKSPAV